jgi:hypothetical protein
MHSAEDSQFLESKQMTASQRELAASATVPEAGHMPYEDLIRPKGMPRWGNGMVAG